MLNPSTADANIDDQTICACMRYAKLWGFGGLEVVNLYAFRATDPSQLWKADDPIGPDNEQWLTRAGMSGKPLVAAWGGNARPNRVCQVLAIPGFDQLTCLRVTKMGTPHHPLYLPKELTPVPWPAR
jgi:hypothetical protein